MAFGSPTWCNGHRPNAWSGIVARWRYGHSSLRPSPRQQNSFNFPFISWFVWMRLPIELNFDDVRIWSFGKKFKSEIYFFCFCCFSLFFSLTHSVAINFSNWNGIFSLRMRKKLLDLNDWLAGSLIQKDKIIFSLSQTSSLQFRYKIYSKAFHVNWNLRLNSRSRKYPFS